MIYTLKTPLTKQEGLDAIFRIAYLTKVKGTELPLIPVLTEAMDKLVSTLSPGLGEFKEAQSKAAHRVQRNRDIAAGGLTDEQQAMVLELHSLVDEDGNGTVEKEELEAAVGDKRGKNKMSFFEKLDVDTDGHVEPLEFLKYFEDMSKERGKKAVEGLLGFVKKGVERLRLQRDKEKELEEGEAAEEEGTEE